MLNSIIPAGEPQSYRTLPVLHLLISRKCRHGKYWNKEFTSTLGRPVLCRRGGLNDAALLPVRWHGEHRLEDGVDRGSLAYPS